MSAATWTKIRLALVAAYVVGYVWWFFANGVIIDRISVLLSVAIFLVIASLGRPPRFWLMMFGDLALFVLMWLAYDESRGIADRVGFPLQIQSVRNIDRVMFLGSDPVVWLQETFYRGPGNVQWYDVVGSMVYYSHFIVPPASTATSGCGTCDGSRHCCSSPARCSCCYRPFLRGWRREAAIGSGSNSTCCRPSAGPPGQGGATSGSTASYERGITAATGRTRSRRCRRCTPPSLSSSSCSSGGGSRIGGGVR
jgi:uncharacterized membrane protein YgcG